MVEDAAAFATKDSLRLLERSVTQRAELLGVPGQTHLVRIEYPRRGVWRSTIDRGRSFQATMRTPTEAPATSSISVST